MAGLLDIREHLVFYRKYHFNQVNVAIHLVCIPIILLSFICFSIDWAPIKGFPPVGVLVAWSYGIYYTVLDWQLGAPSLLYLVAFAHYQRAFYNSLTFLSAMSKKQYTQYAIALHVVAWLAQFYGHGVHEKRAPALVDNLLQAIVLAPFFVVYEIAFWMGYKLDIKKDMDNKAGKLVRQMNAEAKRPSDKKKPL